MKIFQINGGVFGSTGRIMFLLADEARKLGHTVLCAAPVTSTNRRRQPEQSYIRIGSYYGRCLNVLMARLTGLEGCFSVLPTWRLLRKIHRFSPDVLHLHSIHNSYLNIPMLFRYIKKNNIRVVWTLHDCWAVTGHCAYFDMARCSKWKTECCNCPQYKDYPKSYVDNSRFMHKKKKKWFLGVQDMTLITPSQWLVGVVKASFLKDYPVQAIPNGIDLSVFRPRESDFREKYGCENKTIVLGVAFDWSQRKGLDVFIELAKRLDNQFQIVIVGADEAVEKQLPENVISIRRTQNQQELAEIYTAADVFVNPSLEETMGLVTAEALACGTPAVVYNKTAVPEVVDEDCGIVVEAGDIQGIIESIMIATQLDSAAPRKRAAEYDKDKKYREYISVYDRGILP